MNPAARQQALAALDAARPYLARLDVAGHPEDVAADMIDGWSAVETALRSLMGGSALGGQALVRELRQREILSLDTGHALLEFLGARDRAQRTTYRPTGGDVAAARDAFQRLEAELRQGGGPSTAGVAAGLASATLSPPLPPASGARAQRELAPEPPDLVTVPREVPRPAGRRSVWRNPIFLVLLGVVALAGGYFAYAALAPRLDREEPLAAGLAALRQGRREAARGEFERVARVDPTLAAPHVYLARLAREDGDLAAANRELQTAIRLEPRNAIALREMGLYALQVRDPELARRFLVRAVEAAPADSAAQGYLGCALIQLGRREEGIRFVQRAGPGGTWAQCANQAPVQPGAVPGAPAGAYPPGSYPPAAGPPPRL